MTRAFLALEDGRIFEGQSFGAIGTSLGEIVFNTSLTGYLEVITDPSYRGQIVTMTCPHIGNVGITYEDLESSQPHIAGLVVREISEVESSWRSELSLQDYFKNSGIVGISEVDTRAITLHIREAGAMKACISSEDIDPQELVERAKNSPSISERDLVDEVSCSEILAWDDPVDGRWYINRSRNSIAHQKDLHVVAYDFGIKSNILRSLRDRVKRVTVVPASTSAERVMQLEPDGIFLSNGPGDPEQVAYAIDEVDKLIAGNMPTFGICLGLQVMGLAFGARSYKLKFGHRGCNQPVKDLTSGQVEITSHNHGFAIKDLPAELELTHLCLNDDTIEGFEHRKLPAFGVQYHPEAAPGPHDSGHLFDRFIQSMLDTGSGACQNEKISEKSL